MVRQTAPADILHHYRTLAHMLPDYAVFLLDTKLHIILAGGQALRTIFQMESGPSNQLLHDIWPNYLLGTTLVKLHDVAKGVPQSWRVQTLERTLELHAIPIIDSEIAIMVTVRDATQEQKELELLRSDAARYKAIVEENHELQCRMTVDGVLTFANGALCRQSQQSADQLIGTSFYGLCLERDVPLLRHTFRSLSGTKRDLALEIRMRSVGAIQRWVRWSFHPVMDAGGNIAEIQGSGYDITDEVRAHTAEKKQQDLMKALRDIASVLNSTLDLNEVLDHIMDIIDLVVSYDTVNVMLVQDDVATIVKGQGYDTHHVKGVMSLNLRIRRVPHLRYMWETRKELVISNAQAPNTPGLDVPELAWVQSYVGAPIISEDKVIGFLNLESVTPDFFSADDGRGVRAFADTAALAIRNAQLFEQAKAVAVMEEKQRLARELHDAVSQTLFSANMIADAIPLMLEKQPEQIPQQLRLFRQQTQLAMAELRAMLFELRPSALEDADIQKLLEQMIQAIGGRTMMDVQLETRGDAYTGLSLEVKVALYRIAQESINNAIQHATASSMLISLYATEDWVQLTISDNGRGFDPHKTYQGHMGLRIMQERAQWIGATLTITSQPNQGTTIDVIWKQHAQDA
ncbi:MAG: GAF domain-containing protein [Anaerolineae bacterium]|nr:GAF domain-containing protein [Anaerolineae bacterium]